MRRRARTDEGSRVCARSGTRDARYLAMRRRENCKVAGRLRRVTRTARGWAPRRRRTRFPPSGSAYTEYAAAEAASLPVNDEPTRWRRLDGSQRRPRANAAAAADAQKAHIGVISDVGAMARAVSGLVDMAAKQVSKSDAAEGGGENGAPADLREWQRSERGEAPADAPPAAPESIEAVAKADATF